MWCPRSPRPPSLSTEASVCPAGERPFVCLICLSAFTTKANCERHLKVHTDTLNGECTSPVVPVETLLSHPLHHSLGTGTCSPRVSPWPLGATLPAQPCATFPAGVCHSCGFISTTRDILYSHLVTNHMICQPGSKGEVYSPGTALPAAKPLAPGGCHGGTHASTPRRAWRCHGGLQPQTALMQGGGPGRASLCRGCRVMGRRVTPVPLSPWQG